MNARVHPRRVAAFTIVEIMLAIAIFSMVLTAIYSSWSAILRAARVGADAAAEIQRARMASRTLEDALIASVMFSANGRWYAFESDTSEEFAYLSFVARLPPSFPGSGYFGDQVVRRVTFEVAAGRDGVNQLVLTQLPLLQTNIADGSEHSIVLAREVSLFGLEFWDARANDWTGEWLQTNQLPKMVRFTLAFGQTAGSRKPKELTTRVVSLAAVAVQPAFQLPAAMGAPPPPGGVVPPGGQPLPPGAPGAPGVRGDRPGPGAGPRPRTGGEP